MPQKAILFYLHNVRYDLRDKEKLRRWISETVIAEKNQISEIAFIICNDEYLLELNKTFLNHDTLTDVISFNLSDKPKSIKGEIYISVDRVKENAKKYRVGIKDELHRVMIHGVLHLVGYNDVTEKEKFRMRKREDYYLSLR